MFDQGAIKTKAAKSFKSTCKETPMGARLLLLRYQGSTYIFLIPVVCNAIVNRETHSYDNSYSISTYVVYGALSIATPRVNSTVPPNMTNHPELDYGPPTT